MLVDTGATMIALPTSEATRLDVDYKKGQMTLGSTAKGAAPADLGQTQYSRAGRY